MTHDQVKQGTVEAILFPDRILPLSDLSKGSVGSGNVIGAISVVSRRGLETTVTSHAHEHTFAYDNFSLPYENSGALKFQQMPCHIKFRQMFTITRANEFHGNRKRHRKFAISKCVNCVQ